MAKYSLLTKTSRWLTIRCKQWLMVGKVCLESHRRHLHLLSSRRQGNRNGSEINPSTNGRRHRRREAFVISPVFADSRVSNTIAGNQLRECVRKWQSPPDPSTNHNIASDRQHEGTAEWFFESDKFENWKVTGSLLWIHGKRTFFYLRLRWSYGPPVSQRAPGRASYGSSFLKSCSIGKLMIVE